MQQPATQQRGTGIHQCAPLQTPSLKRLHQAAAAGSRRGWLPRKLLACLLNRVGTSNRAPSMLGLTQPASSARRRAMQMHRQMRRCCPQINQLQPLLLGSCQHICMCRQTGQPQRLLRQSTTG